MQDLTELPFDDTAIAPSWLDRPPVMTDNECSAWLLRDMRSAGAARTLLRTFLERRKDGELYLEDGKLVVSELVTNALLHGSTEEPDTLIHVRFECLPDVLRIEVHDASGKLPAARTAGVNDECGRGLLLVKQLALSWGCEPRDGIGKRTWAELPPADRSA
jgi:anti-sigma regulatory factor (Ser/Thr protein kinase)